jgi:glycopeptide antibiotics resistance protein
MGPRDDPVSASRPILTREQYWCLTFGFLALVVYGSLVPLHFRFIPLDEAVTRYNAALSAPLRMESRSDWAANILLFIPLGFLLMAALAVDRGPKASWAAALAVLPTCTLLSASIEFTQLYFPPRVTALNDIVAESIGGLLGTTVWLVGGQRITHRLRRFWVDLGGENTAESLLTAYIGFLVLVHAVPMDLTISPVEIYHKYREGRVILVPFAGWFTDILGGITKSLTNVAFFLPVGMLLAGFSHPFWRRWRNWLAVVALGSVLAALIEVMQLFVYTRFFETTDIVTGSLAVLAGWAMALAYGQQPSVAPPTAASGAETQLNDAKPKNLAVAYGILGVWLALLVFINWQPFNFNFSLDDAARRLQKMSFVPFADYQQGEYLHAFDQIFSKTVLFMPVGALLALLCSSDSRHDRGLLVVPAGIVLTTLVGAPKFFLPTRYASVTDVLIETFGIWLGFVISRRIRAGQSAGKQRRQESPFAM